MNKNIVRISYESGDLYVAPELTDGYVDYHNENLFDQENVRKNKRHLSMNKLPDCSNLAVRNQMWSFVSYTIIELKQVASMVARKLYDLEYLANVVDIYYPTIGSLLDIPLEKAKALVKQQKQALGYKGEPTKYLSNHIDANGNRVEDVRSPSYFTTYNLLWKYLTQIEEDPSLLEYDKDVWDVRKLGIHVDIAAHKPIFRVDFSGISQPWFKELAKDYIYFILPTHSVSTATQDMVVFRHLSEFLRSNYPLMRSFTEFDRSVAEGFLRFVGARGYSANWHNECISAVKTFFTVELMRKKDVPKNNVFLDSDYHKKTTGAPDYFTDYELKQINEHLNDVSPIIARMTIILEECGMRLSDLCSSKITIDGRPCLVENSDGEYSFTYYMPKTKRNNTIPISTLAALTIKSAIAETKTKFGASAVFIFSKSLERSVSTDNYRRAMQAMAHKNNLETDSGEPLIIKGHSFRGTVATEYVNNGLDMTLIKDLLGQKTIGVLKHYAEIHSSTMATYLQPLIDEDNRMIASIGNDPVVQPVAMIHPEESLIPLANGGCAKKVEAGLCDDLYQCLKCSIFHPTKSDLPVLTRQYKVALRNVELANSQGFTRIAEINEALANMLKAVIDRIEGE